MQKSKKTELSLVDLIMINGPYAKIKLPLKASCYKQYEQHKCEHERMNRSNKRRGMAGKTVKVRQHIKALNTWE